MNSNWNLEVFVLFYILARVLWHCTAGEGGQAASFLSCEGRIPGSPLISINTQGGGAPGYSHVGVLASNMTFTATAMGMALLPLGNGEAPQSPFGLP